MPDVSILWKVQNNRDILTSRVSMDFPLSLRLRLLLHMFNLTLRHRREQREYCQRRTLNLFNCVWVKAKDKNVPVPDTEFD